MGRTKSYLDYETELLSGDAKNMNRASAMWANRVPKQVYVANNEQKPYTEEELGLPTLPMPPKNKLGHNQTGDYQIFIPHLNRTIGMGWERKTVEDLYSTLVHNKERFDNECMRALDIYDYLIIGVECTRERFLKYRPRGQPGASIASRVGIITHFEPRYKYRVILKWCGNRQNACRELVTQGTLWLQYNWPKMFA